MSSAEDAKRISGFGCYCLGVAAGNLRGCAQLCEGYLEAGRIGAADAYGAAMRVQTAANYAALALEMVGVGDADFLRGLTAPGEGCTLGEGYAEAQHFSRDEVRHASDY